MVRMLKIFIKSDDSNLIGFDSIIVLFHGLLGCTLADPRFDEAWVQFEAFFAVFLGAVEVHQLHVRAGSVRVKLREYILMMVSASFSPIVLPFRYQGCV